MFSKLKLKGKSHELESYGYEKDPENKAHFKGLMFNTKIFTVEYIEQNKYSPFYDKAKLEKFLKERKELKENATRIMNMLASHGGLPA